jgi:hypothetical protein
MYLFIDTVNNEIDLQPTETIVMSRFYESFDEVKQFLYDEIKNMNQIINDHSVNETLTHTLRIFKVVDGFDFIFNPMTSHYIFTSQPLIEENYESCDL